MTHGRKNIKSYVCVVFVSFSSLYIRHVVKCRALNTYIETIISYIHLKCE